MKRHVCACGQAVYFDNQHCGNCSRKLAFNPLSLTMTAEAEAGAGLPFCKNRDSAIACNWLVSGGSDFCLSCLTSRVIPDLSNPENLDRWRKLEKAKRRLIYDLLSVGLPVDPSRLRFEFKEDRRTNPDVRDDHVSIGHANGVITINAAEADELYREEMRQQMNEPYRTLIGHFRHESGHYFFNVVVNEALRPVARELFGDESVPYDEALRKYYRDGPPSDWTENYISRYATAHPAEDWAECWAHYLHIRAVLETAEANKLRTAGDEQEWQSAFIELAMAVNEVLRSMGLRDAYPFVITAPIAAKIAFIHKAIRAYSERLDGP